MLEVKATATFFFDTRRITTEGTYPIKLTIYYNGKKKRYNTNLSVTEDVWKKIHSEKLRDDNIKTTRRLLNEKLDKANAVLNKLPTFTFDGFEDAFFEKKGTESQSQLDNAFDEYVKPLQKNGRVKSCEAYITAKKSLLKFRPNLKLQEVTAEFLESYESYMTKNGASTSTIGIYLRHLRAVINKSIADGVLQQDKYPFSKFKIPSGRNSKKALSFEELKKLLEYNPKNLNHAKALDYWIFSYICNGINMKDVCLLTPANIDGDIISYHRAKTINTKKRDIRPIRIIITERVRDIIERRKNQDKKAMYLFPILKEGLAPVTLSNRVHKFISLTNKYMGEIADDLEIKTPVLTYAARHTHATVLKRKGVSTQVIQENLGHSSVSVTENYLDSFTDEVKKEYANLLTEI